MCIGIFDECLVLHCSLSDLRHDLDPVIIEERLNVLPQGINLFAYLPLSSSYFCCHSFIPAYFVSTLRLSIRGRSLRGLLFLRFRRPPTDADNFKEDFWRRVLSAIGRKKCHERVCYRRSRWTMQQANTENQSKMMS